MRALFVVMCLWVDWVTTECPHVGTRGASWAEDPCATWRFSCLARTDTDSGMPVRVAGRAEFADKRDVSYWGGVGGTEQSISQEWTAVRSYFHAHEADLRLMTVKLELTAYGESGSSASNVDLDSLQVVRVGMHPLNFAADGARFVTNAYVFGVRHSAHTNGTAAMSILDRARQGAWDAVVLTVEILGLAHCQYSVVPMSTSHANTALDGALRGMACNVAGGGMCILTVPEAHVHTDGDVALTIKSNESTANGTGECTAAANLTAAVFSLPNSPMITCGTGAPASFLPMYYNLKTEQCTPCAQNCTPGMYAPGCYTHMDTPAAITAACVACPLAQYLSDMHMRYVPGSEYACQTGCLPGFVASSNPDVPCVLCGKNTYGDGSGSACTECPAGTMTLESGSVESGQCISDIPARCPPGSGVQGNERACSTCPADTFNVGNTSQCTACPGDTKTAHHAVGARGAHECAFCGKNFHMSRSRGHCVACSTCTFVAEDIHTREACIECDAFLKTGDGLQQDTLQCPNLIMENNECYRQTPIQHLHECTMDVFTSSDSNNPGSFCNEGRCRREFQIDASFSRGFFEDNAQASSGHEYLNSENPNKNIINIKRCKAGSGAFNFCRLRDALNLSRPVFYVTSGYTAFNLTNMQNSHKPSPTYEDMQGNYDCAACFRQDDEPFHAGYMTLYTFQTELLPSVRHKTSFFDFTRLGFQYFSNAILPEDLHKCRERWKDVSSNQKMNDREKFCYEAYDPNMPIEDRGIVFQSTQCLNNNLAPRNVSYPAGQTKKLCLTNNVGVELALLEGGVHAHYNDRPAPLDTPNVAVQATLDAPVLLAVRIRPASAAETGLRVARLRVQSVFADDDDALALALNLSCTPGETDGDCTRLLSTSGVWEVSTTHDTVTMRVAPPSANLLASLFGGEWAVQLTLDNETHTADGAGFRVEVVLCATRGSALLCTAIANTTLSVPGNVSHTTYAYETCTPEEYELRGATLEHGAHFALLRETVAEHLVCGMLDETNAVDAASRRDRRDAAMGVAVDSTKCHS